MIAAPAAVEPAANPQAAFRALLDKPIVSDAVGGQLQRVRFLVLRNLAGLLAEQGGFEAEEALRLYLEAIQVDGTDAVLWHRFGTLVRKRDARSRGAISPRGRPSCHPRQHAEGDGAPTRLQAALLGRWAEARYSLEQGLVLDPGHSGLQLKLLQLLRHVGDEHCASQLADAIARWARVQPGIGKH